MPKRKSREEEEITSLKREFSKQQSSDPRFKGENKTKELREFKSEKRRKNNSHYRGEEGSYKDADLAMEEEVNLYHDAEPIQIAKDPRSGKYYFVTPTWEPGYTIGIFGSRGTGKSYIARWIAAILAPFYPIVYVFTETTMNGYWASMTNPQFIYTGYQESKLVQILKLQEKRVSAWRQGKFKGNPYILIIWDDCVPADMMYDPLFRQIFFNGRHYCIGNWFISQYFYAVPRRYRGNLDWVFSLHQEQKCQIEAFFEEMSYGGKGKEGYNRFKEVFDNATKDRDFILFDIRDKEKPSKDRIYTGRAEDPGIFWLGSKDFWSKNFKHLQKIMSGEAREIAERTLNYQDFGLPDLKELKEKRKKKEKEEDSSSDEEENSLSKRRRV